MEIVHMVNDAIGRMNLPRKVENQEEEQAIGTCEKGSVTTAYAVFDCRHHLKSSSGDRPERGQTSLLVGYGCDGFGGEEAGGVRGAHYSAPRSFHSPGRQALSRVTRYLESCH